MRRETVVEAKIVATDFAVQAMLLLSRKINSKIVAGPLHNTREATNLRKLSMKMSKLMVELRKAEPKEGL
jgi:hypothetical protein